MKITNGGSWSIGNTIVDANGVLGIVKYSTSIRSVRKYVVGRERMEGYGS